jgi:hypothetical protein
MAHFAQLDENNTVINVIVVSNDVLLNKDDYEGELLGVNFCKSVYGEETRWIQTSYNNSFRGDFAGLGFYYNEELDVFENPEQLVIRMPIVEE